MKKFLKQFSWLIIVSLLLLWLWFAALVQRTNSKNEISQKRMVFTDSWLPTGNYIADINSWGKVIIYWPLTDGGWNRFLTGAWLSGYVPLSMTGNRNTVYNRMLTNSWDALYFINNSGQRINISQSGDYFNAHSGDYYTSNPLGYITGWDVSWLYLPLAGNTEDTLQNNIYIANARKIEWSWTNHSFKSKIMLDDKTTSNQFAMESLSTLLSQQAQIWIQSGNIPFLYYVSWSNRTYVSLLGKWLEYLNNYCTWAWDRNIIDKACINNLVSSNYIPRDTSSLSYYNQLTPSTDISDDWTDFIFEWIWTYNLFAPKVSLSSNNAQIEMWDETTNEFSIRNNNVSSTGVFQISDVRWIGIEYDNADYCSGSTDRALIDKACIASQWYITGETEPEFNAHSGDYLPLAGNTTNNLQNTYWMADGSKIKAQDSKSYNYNTYISLTNPIIWFVSEFSWGVVSWFNALWTIWLSWAIPTIYYNGSWAWNYDFFRVELNTGWLVYSSDYSGKYTDRSLVDRWYVKNTFSTLTLWFVPYRNWTVFSNTNIFNTGGNVGIKTNNPLLSLDVSGSVLTKWVYFASWTATIPAGFNTWDAYIGMSWGRLHVFYRSGWIWNISSDLTP